MLHGLDEASRAAGRVGGGVIKLEPLEVLGSGISSTPRGHLVDGLDQVAVDAVSHHCLHHSQVLEIVVGLEQSIAGEELDENASNTPDITGIRPSEIGRAHV